MKKTVFNREQIPFIIGSAVIVPLFCASLILQIVGRIDSVILIIFLGLTSLLDLYILLTSPLTFTFDSEGIKIKYFFGLYEQASWEEIKEINYEYPGGAASFVIVTKSGETHGKHAYFTKGNVKIYKSVSGIVRQYWKEDFEVYKKKRKDK